MLRFPSVSSCVLFYGLATIASADGDIQVPNGGGEVPGTPYIARAAYLNLCLDALLENQCPEGRLRPIDIHRINPGGLSAAYEYAHKPAFLPVAAGERQTEAAKNNGWPTIVWDIKSGLEDETKKFATFRLLISNTDIQEKAEDVVRNTKSEQNYVTKQKGFTLSDVDVLPFKATRIIFKIVGLPDGITLAEVEKTTNVADVDYVDLFVPITQEKSELLKRVLNSGDVEFQVQFSYLGSKAASSASLRSINVVEITQQIDELLDSKQLSVGDPISQKEKDSLSQRISAIASVNIQANDADLIDKILDKELISLTEQMFEKAPDPMSIEEFTKNRSADAVEGFLQPIYDEVKEISKEYDEKKEIDENNRTVEISLGNKNKGATGKITEQDKNRIERKYGVSFEEINKDKILEPHALTVSFVSENYASIANDSMVSISLADPSVRGYDEPVTIPGSMVVSSDFIGTSVYSLGTNVPIGAALCTFAATLDPPEGFVWIKEGTTWPDDETIFGSLAGKEIPKMSGIFPAFTENLESVGIVSGGAPATNSTSLEISTTKSDHGLLTITDRSTVASADTDTSKIMSKKRNPNQLVAGPVPPDTLVFAAPSGVAWRESGKGPSEGQFSFGLFRLPKVGTEITSAVGTVLTNVQGLSSAITHQTVGDISFKINIPSLSIDHSKPVNLPKNLPCRWIVRVK